MMPVSHHDVSGNAYNTYYFLHTYLSNYVRIMVYKIVYKALSSL